MRLTMRSCFSSYRSSTATLCVTIAATYAFKVGSVGSRNGAGSGVDLWAHRTERLWSGFVAHGTEQALERTLWAHGT